jgi:hypothetical protein
MNDPVERLAEARIQEAMARGELSNLPGEGQPLQLDDRVSVPEELRVAYRLLKNAGFLPPEVQLRRDIAEAEELLLAVTDNSERSKARAQLQLLRIRLDGARRHGANLLVEKHYHQKLLERLGHN